MTPLGIKEYFKRFGFEYGREMVYLLVLHRPERIKLRDLRFF
jgi:hypothetical protein